jgi:hypothetical protein
MPYSGFEANYANQKTGANDYMHKHKWTYQHQKLRESRKWLIFSKSLDELQLGDNNELPQWMFITPNMSMSFFLLLFEPELIPCGF